MQIQACGLLKTTQPESRTKEATIRWPLFYDAIFMPATIARSIRQASPACGLLLLTGWLYYGALDTAFWGDDYHNLFGLALIGEEGYANFVFSGIAGPSGRPLSLLLFALQHESWPNDPFSFKLVNLCIHLLNGALIFLICRRLAALTRVADPCKDLFPLLVATLWLIHPLQITTVLYVVQRMTQLAVFFTLSGLYGYLHYRGRYMNSGNLKDLTGMSLAVGCGLILGVLSKEIGILLPLYILILESTLLTGLYKGPRLRWWAGVFLVGPLAMLLMYLAAHFNATLGDFETRHFGMLERLLTQPMVLFDYLSKIFLPQVGGFSIFNDDFPVVNGWGSPPEMVLYLIGIAGLLGLGLYYRRRQPVVGFAILWFLGGHLLESSFLSLELYFEHRNYLPLLGPCVLVAWWIIRLGSRYKKAAGYAAATLIVLLLSLGTARETASYEDLYSKAVERASLQPESVRAWSNLMDLNVAIGDYDRFTESFRQITTNQNHALLLYVKKIHFTACYFHRAVPEADWDAVFAKLDLDEWYARGTIGAIDDVVKAMLNRDCRLVDPYRLVNLIINLVGQPRYIKYGGMLHELAALVCVHIGDSQCALANINQATTMNPTPQRFELQLNLLIALKDIEAAQSALLVYKAYLAANPRYMLASRESFSLQDGRVRELAEKTSVRE